MAKRNHLPRPLWGRLRPPQPATRRLTAAALTVAALSPAALTLARPGPAPPAAAYLVPRAAAAPVIRAAAGQPDRWRTRILRIQSRRRRRAAARTPGPATPQPATPQPATPAPSPEAPATPQPSPSPGPAGTWPPGGPQAYAASILPSYGWGPDQMSPCLVPLWNAESGWRWDATNPSSGAYGIPQALPGSKMASAGADWQTNPDTQIRWGLGYIAGLYHTPCGAWAHEQTYGWY